MAGYCFYFIRRRPHYNASTGYVEGRQKSAPPPTARCAACRAASPTLPRAPKPAPRRFTSQHHTPVSEAHCWGQPSVPLHSSADASPAPPLDLNCQREPSVAARADLNCVLTAPEQGGGTNRAQTGSSPPCNDGPVSAGVMRGWDASMGCHPKKASHTTSLPPGFPTLALGVEKYWRRRHTPALTLPPAATHTTTPHHAHHPPGHSQGQRHQPRRPKRPTLRALPLFCPTSTRLSERLLGSHRSSRAQHRTAPHRNITAAVLEAQQQLSWKHNSGRDLGAPCFRLTRRGADRVRRPRPDDACVRRGRRRHPSKGLLTHPLTPLLNILLLTAYSGIRPSSSLTHPYTHCLLPLWTLLDCLLTCLLRHKVYMIET